jgi:hypothetical protein
VWLTAQRTICAAATTCTKAEILALSLKAAQTAVAAANATNYAIYLTLALRDQVLFVNKTASVSAAVALITAAQTAAAAAQTAANTAIANYQAAVTAFGATGTTITASTGTTGTTGTTGHHWYYWYTISWSSSVDSTQDLIDSEVFPPSFFVQNLGCL